MSSTSLELGEIVNVEVRDSSGAVTSFSHDYPIDASSLLRIPSLSPIQAVGKALTPELRDEIHDRFVSDGVFSNLTVNLTLSSAQVDFENKIQPGETLFLRLLGLDGTVDPSSGSFTVNRIGKYQHSASWAVSSSATICCLKQNIKLSRGSLTGGFSPSPSST